MAGFGCSPRLKRSRISTKVSGTVSILAFTHRRPAGSRALSNRTPDSENVDDFVAAEAPGFNKYLQISTIPPEVISWQVFENRSLALFGQGGLGCKRSRVQISAARPNSSKTYIRNIHRRSCFGVQLESNLDASQTASRAHERHYSNSWHLSPPIKNPTNPTFLS